MELLEFKKHLTKCLEDLEKELTNIRNEISSLPPIKDFDLTKYGSKSFFLEQYHLLKPKRLIKIKLKPSASKLQEFAYNYVLNNLNTKLSQIRLQMKEYQNAISKIDEEGKVNTEIYPIINTINELLKFSEARNIQSPTFLSLLSKLTRYTKKNNDQIERIILSDLTTYFDTEGHLNPETSKETLNFMLKKLFMAITIDDPKINAYLDNLEVYLNKIAHQEYATKEALRKEKEALNNLKKYINHGEIIYVPKSINEFLKILSETNLPEQTKKEYRNLMDQAISKRKDKEERAKIKNFLATYLTKEDLKVIDEAQKIILKSPDDEVVILLGRYYEDIISLCKYLDFIKGTTEEQNSLEILTQRVNSLKLIMNNLKNPKKKERNTFYYLTNHYHLPTLMATLELTDITLYEEIFVLLNDLGRNNITGTKVNEQDGIEIYRLYGKNIKITYTKYHNEIIITSISKDMRLKDPEICFSPEEFTEISKLHHTPKDEKTKKLHAIYESLIASQLDLRRDNPNLTFHPPVK